MPKPLHNRKSLLPFRKDLRNNLTPAEARLWKYIKGKQLNGAKFRRQHSVGNYILDFYCPAFNLAIEIDGAYHTMIEQAAYDEERTLFLKELGIKVIRFSNAEVLGNIKSVLEEISVQLFSAEDNH